MPCNDVTELVELDLDGLGRVEELSVQKQTCGAPVGNAGLLRYTRGLLPEQIIDHTLAALVPDLNEAKQLDQFLLAKELIALQSALAVYLGAEAGSPGSPFALASVEHGARRTRIAGLLRVDLATEQIRACGNCGNCKCAVAGRRS